MELTMGRFYRLAQNRISRIRLEALSAFLLTLILIFAALQALDSLYLQRQLRTESGHIAHQVEGAMKQGVNAIDAIPPFNTIACKDGVSRQLAQIVFNNGYVRWLALSRGSDVACKSHDIGLVSPASLLQTRAPIEYQNGIQLVETRSSEGDNILLLRRTRGDMTTLAALEAPIASLVELGQCRRCLQYDITLMRGNDITISSEPLAGEAALRRVDQQTVNGIQIWIEITANQQFRQTYRLADWPTYLAMSLALAFAMAWLVHKRLNASATGDAIFKNAIVNREFIPYYQPIIDTRTNEVLGAEALVRWMRSTGELVMPNEFIPYAEERGYMGEITAQLASKVADDLIHFGWAGSPRYISLNIIPDHIVDDAFRAFLQGLLEQKGIPGSNIALEITERRGLPDLGAAKKQLDRFVDFGTQIMLDDAGTGFGGFSYIQELPISTLKIDRMFVDTLKSDADVKRPVLDAIAEFAKVSGLNAIAEGVEIRDQVDKLSAMGIHRVQGYFFCKPLSAAAFRQWLSTWPRLDVAASA